MKHSRLILYWVALVLSIPAAYASDFDIFIGNYEGKYVPPDGDEKRIRDLGVNIREIKGGLNISWATTTFKKNKPQKKEYSIDFLETDREHIYKAAQKKNLFGGRDPLDPMKGEPYAWVRVEGRTLTVFVLIITDSGDYDMQTYNRILTDDNNLDTSFSRATGGKVTKTLTTILKRKAPGDQEKNK